MIDITSNKNTDFSIPDEDELSKIKNTNYSLEMIAAIKEAEEILKNPDEYKSFENIDDLMEDLNKELN